MLKCFKSDISTSNESIELSEVRPTPVFGVRRSSRPSANVALSGGARFYVPHPHTSNELNQVQHGLPMQARSESIAECLRTSNFSNSVETDNFISQLKDYDSYRHFLDRGRNSLKPRNEHLYDVLQGLADIGLDEVRDFFEPWGWQQVTRIHLAAHRGEIDILERAVATYESNGRRINPLLVTDNLGRCALHYAATAGHSHVVSWILENTGRDSINYQLSLQDVFGRTPLHDAAGSLHVEVVKLLIDAGAKVNVPNERGVPPFLLTEFDAELVTHDVNCLTRYEECVEVFLSAGADVNLVHPVTGWTMLHHAVSLNSPKTTQKLLENNANPASIDASTKDGLSPIQIAATKGNLACVRVLIDKGAKLLGVYPNSDRTVIDALFDSLDDSDLVTFFMKLFDSRIHFLEHQTESAALDYRVLAPLGEESMAVVQALMKKIMTVELRAIMQHPLLLAYIRTEFHRYRRAFWWFLGLWAIYVYPLYLYSDELVYGKINLFWVAVVTPFAACIRILGSTKFPLKLKRKSFKRFENYLVVGSLILTILTTLGAGFRLFSDSPFVLTCLSINWPLVTIQFIMFLSRHPAMGYNLYLLMIIMKRIGKVFIGVLAISLGFGFSFNILFHNKYQFAYLDMAIVKTVVMMTGEYEYGDLFAPTSTDNPNVDNSTSEISTADNSTVPNFDSDDERYSDFTPFYGRIVFVFFILINFVFVNMVIALTVCDTQEVANEAEFEKLREQVKFIADCEWIRINGYLPIPSCLISTEVRRHDVLCLTKPFGWISTKIIRRIFLICKKNRDCDSTSQKSGSSLDNEDVSISITRSELTAFLQSSQQSLIREVRLQRSLIQQLRRSLEQQLKST